MLEDMYAVSTRGVLWALKRSVGIEKKKVCVGGGSKKTNFFQPSSMLVSDLAIELSSLRCEMAACEPQGASSLSGGAAH